MIISIDLSQKIFAIDMLKALKSPLEHCRKHVLRWLRLSGDQALQTLSDHSRKLFNGCDKSSGYNGFDRGSELKSKTLILTFIRAIVTEEESCAPKIFYIDFIVFILFYLKIKIYYDFIVVLLWSTILCF